MSLPPGATNPRRVSGGDINEAWRVPLADGREALVKRARRRPGGVRHGGARPAMAGRAGALRTPRVLEVAGDYLVLEWASRAA